MIEGCFCSLFVFFGGWEACYRNYSPGAQNDQVEPPSPKKLWRIGNLREVGAPSFENFKVNPDGI